MDLFVYGARDDEKEFFNLWQHEKNIEIAFCPDPPAIENIDLSKGYRCISMVATPLSKESLIKLAENGVELIITRTIGYEHIPLELAAELNIKVNNITYSSNSVADFTIMLMMMSLRKAKYVIKHCEVKDYSLLQYQGREMRNMTIGIVGTGRIGQTVIEQLKGFGSKIVAYDPYPNEALKSKVEYIAFEDLIQTCDIISFHAPSTPETFHILNKNNLNLVKKGAILINTSRGNLIDNDAIILGVEKSIFSAVALDVLDKEPPFFNRNYKSSLYVNHDVAILESYPNVIITPHIAFYTDQAVKDMVDNTIKGVLNFYEKH